MIDVAYPYKAHTHISEKLKPGLWDSDQLADYLRSNNKHRLANWVISNHVSAQDFTNLNQALCDSSLFLDFATDDYDDLLRESRTLRLMLHSRKFRTTEDTSSSKEESDCEVCSITKSKVARRRVQSMVAAIEVGQTKAVNLSPTSSPVSELRVPEEDGSSVVRSWVQDTTAAQAEVRLERPASSFLSSSERDGSQEEYSVESMLLKESPNSKHIFGAQAWEQDLAVGTAKKLVAPKPGYDDVTNNMAPYRLSSLFSKELETLSDRDIGVNQVGTADAFPASVQTIAVKVGEHNAQIYPPQENPIGSDGETIKALNEWIAELEANIRKLENVRAQDAPDVEDDLELPRYLFMVGLGVCAIVGQAIVKRFIWSRR